MMCQLLQTLAPFLWIKMVKACFQLLGNILFIQQWDIVLWMTVFRIEHLFRIMILIWSWGQGEPLDFILLMFVISWYVGFSSLNELDGFSSSFIHAGNSNELWWFVCFMVFLKWVSQVTLSNPGFMISSFSNMSLQ